MNHANHTSTRGFTLVELMLSMTFVAILLVAISMTTIQVSNIYARGVTLRAVNQVGRSVSDDLKRSVAGAVQLDLTTDYKVQGTSGGRLCLGKYSYIWNYKGAGVNKYTNDAPVRFAKVADAGALLCSAPGTKVDPSKATELLASGDRDLVLHKLIVTAGASDDVSLQSLYAITMVIGTNSGNELTTGDASCKPPVAAGGYEEYCSVNQFDIVVRAGNQLEEDK